MARKQKTQAGVLSEGHPQRRVGDAGNKEESRPRCLTCHQLLPPNQLHPPVIGQKAPGGKTRLDAMDSIAPLFCFLAAIHDAICCLTKPDFPNDAEGTLHGLAWLAEDLSAELQRRTDWLYEVGKASQAEQSA